MPNILIKQHDITDCGASCLASIAAHYKLRISIAKIRQFAGTDIEGTNILGLLTAAQKLGFEAKGVKGSLISLNLIPIPAIAHIVTKEQLLHYVVIYKVTSKEITIMDPAIGEMDKKSIEAFCKEWTGALLILLPNQHFKIWNKQISMAYRLYLLVKPHRGIITQALFGSIIYTILGLSTAIYVQKIVDFVLVDGNRNLLNLMSILMIGILIFQSFIGAIKGLFVMRTGQQLDAQLILGYYKHLLKLPQQFFDTMRIGEIISRVNDAVKIRTFINETAISIVINLLIIIFSFLLMFTYYWKIAILMLFIIPVYLIIYIITNSLHKRIQRKLMEQSAELESQFVESLNAMKTIKRFGLAEFMNIKTETTFVKLLQTVYVSGKISLFTMSTIEITSHLLTIILLWFGAGYVLDNEVTPGELFSFYALIGYFTGPAGALISANKVIQDAVIASDRLFEIMDLETEQNGAEIELKSNLIGDINFEHVDFSYNTRQPVFMDLNLKIKAGSFTAIVGESGSGKSTLMSLLQNIYPLQSGNIFIGKYALQYLDLVSLRKLLSVVPQEIDLFSGSIIDNIAMGSYEPDLQRVIDICSQLGILDFIENLPYGFQTNIGENGVSLSGGQRQRVAIARALYRNPEILILDEATASLNSSSENYVKQTIAHLVRQHKTIIIIAHRLSTIKNANHIIVLDKGKVVEEGTHNQMMNSKRNYYRLWKQQFGNN